jgi:hypothetical protein
VLIDSGGAPRQRRLALEINARPPTGPMIDETLARSAFRSLVEAIKDRLV